LADNRLSLDAEALYSAPRAGEIPSSLWRTAGAYEYLRPMTKIEQSALRRAAKVSLGQANTGLSEWRTC